jgi:serine/threonine protein kinase/class 3 adenylate cyclase
MEAPPVICGKYVLERPLAQGGMGAIWVAFDPQLKRRVALKTMHRDALGEGPALERFEAEATTIAQLQSPHVVQVFDFGVAESVPYIAMELLTGEDLAARLERVQRMPLQAFAPIFAQVAKALTAAHAAGIIHRDLKPGNVFLTRSGADEVVKLVDFGIAAVAGGRGEGDDASGRTGMLIGTPHYMSPEQARGRALDHRSDLWSLAVVAYQALTGQLPFSAKTLSDVILAVCADPVTPPSSIVPELGVEVDRFFERALARDPASRFQSAHEMVSSFFLVAEPAAGPRGAKILVVDDEPDMPALIRQRFRRRIQDKSLSFLFASDGLQALDLLRLHSDIDVVVSDIRMPHMDGLTMLAHVAEIAPLTKVILVSAFGDMVNIREAMNRGAFDFLVKPVDFKDLQATIDKTIQHVREAQRTLRSARENDILRMFVNHHVVDRLPASMRGVGTLQGEAVEATVAFIGIHDLGALLDTEAPHRAIEIANAVFEIIVPEIFVRGGTIAKLTVEGVLALFQDDGHTERAIAAAVAARAEIQRRVRREPDAVMHAIGVRAGIDAGKVVFGAVGAKSLRRMEYAVVGRAVRTATRLAALAKHDQVLVEEALSMASGGALQGQPMGLVQLPGRKDPVEVANVVGHSAARSGEGASQTTVLLGAHSVVVTHMAYDGSTRS